jgi:hypothetical protein
MRAGEQKTDYRVDNILLDVAEALNILARKYAH